MSLIKATKILVLLLIVAGGKLFAQGRPNWTDDQLMEPSVLAAKIKSGKNLPIIFSVGPGAIIPHSIDIGMVKETENLQKLKEQLSNISKDKQIVVYCGCCPFEHCPNVRPAIEMLKSMNFTNYRLLNLSHNIKMDWIDKGYPTSE